MQDKGGFFTLLLPTVIVIAALAIVECHAAEESLLALKFEDLLDDVIAEERASLYPITRYAGMGYNYLRGNPEGDFMRGGKDPGLKDTRWILNLTYAQNKGQYNARTVFIPDQVEFQPSQTCASRSSTRAYSGQKSYQKELQRNIKFGLSDSSIYHYFLLCQN